MKRQVITNIIDSLTREKVQLRYFLRPGKKIGSHHRAIWRGRLEAYENAIQICLKEADILDLRPAHEKDGKDIK